MIYCLSYIHLVDDGLVKHVLVLVEHILHQFQSFGKCLLLHTRVNPWVSLSSLVHFHAKASKELEEKRVLELLEVVSGKRHDDKLSLHFLRYHVGRLL